jgi:hypothetical protein
MSWALRAWQPRNSVTKRKNGIRLRDVPLDNKRIIVDAEGLGRLAVSLGAKALGTVRYLGLMVVCGSYIAGSADTTPRAGPVVCGAGRG